MASKKEKYYIGNYESTNANKERASIELRRQSIGKNLNFAASEAYKLLRTNLMFSMSDESECKVIGVTSALRGEGKSTTSMNLSYSLAEGGKKVLLVEADMRIPVVSSVLQIASAPGLSHVLAGLSNLNDAIRNSGLNQNFSVLPAGEIPPNPSEMLSSRRMQQVVEALSKAYDYIVIDLPPINAVSDGLAVSALLSGMILVVRQDYCDQHALAEAMRQLEFLKVKLLGFVLNGAESEKKNYRHYKKYKNYRYGYNSNYGYQDEYGKRSNEEAKMVDDQTSAPIYYTENNKDSNV